MKKILMVLLILALLSPCLTGVLPAVGAASAKAPLYLFTTANTGGQYSYISQLPTLTVTLQIAENGTKTATIHYGSLVDEDAAIAVKNVLKNLPAGFRYMYFDVQEALLAAGEDVVYFDSAVVPMQKAFEKFFRCYRNNSGLIDGVLIYQNVMGLNNEACPSRDALYTYHYAGEPKNTDIYRQIVENPLYETTIRPMLVERGFRFQAYNEVSPEKVEIFTLNPTLEYPERYVHCHMIWNAVMESRIAQHLTEAVYAPMTAYFPDADMADIHSRDSAGWVNNPTDTAEPGYRGGNQAKAGNTSCYNVAAATSLEGKSFVGLNNVSIEMSPFFQAKWDINQVKNTYESTDTGKLYAWIGAYTDEAMGLSANPAYYTETLYHLALQGVDTFFGDLAQNQQPAEDILYRLNYLIGNANRKPVDLPLSWNYDFLLSGTTMGAKRYYRITPNVDLVSREAFRVSNAKDPTFAVNGQTVTFPGGKIITESKISDIGSCGYWVQTSANVLPTITSNTGRYTENPAYQETFSSPLDATVWKQSGTPVTVEDGKLVAKGGTVLKHVVYPQRLTLNGDVATCQRWQVTVTLPAGLNDDAEMNLLVYGWNDTGIRITQNKILVDVAGEPTALLDVDFAAGGTYTLVRDVDFSVKGKFQCSYYIYDTQGECLAKAEDCPMPEITLPYTSLNMTWTRVKSAILLDDYALSYTGHTAVFAIYNGDTGVTVTSQQQYDIGYRLTWLNNTDQTKKAEIIAVHYNAEGDTVSEEILETIQMAPGTDGAVTGIAQRKTEGVFVYLKEEGKAYTVTMTNSGRDAKGVDKYLPGDTVTLNAGTRAGFTFTGWTADKVIDFADAKALETTFVMPAGDVNVTANWTLTVVEGIKPYVMTNWAGVATGKYSNICSMPQLYNHVIDGQVVISYQNCTDIKTVAQLIKAQMDGRPAGTRWINGAAFGNVLRTNNDDVMFMEQGVEIVRNWLDEFLTEYKAIGGELDGIALDFEYFDAEYWFLNSRHYTKDKTVYQRIVANPNYETKLRPLLVERGFKFWPEPTEHTPEIYGIYPESGNEYSQSRYIWDAAAQCLLSMYQNESMAPLFEHYPEADVNDYTVKDVRSWLKPLDDGGAPIYLGGNRDKMGTASSYNTYSYAPTMIYSDNRGGYSYRKPAAYNKAAYEDDPYNMFMWDVNSCKLMYDATPEKQVSMWFAAYCYSPDRPGSTSYTPYYAEAILHMGLMNPEPFLGFIVAYHDFRMPTMDEYYAALQVASDVLAELTRIVGAEDRKYIEFPYTWNSGYMLTGMYAGGRNYWRITPDTTDGMTVEAFQISKDGEDPTFSIGGQTVTFPGGKIIEDGYVSEVGTCGYWVETATDVMPKISYAVDRFETAPSFMENYEQYAVGTKYTGSVCVPTMVWETRSSMGGTSLIMEDPADPSNKVLAISGKTVFKNIQMPKNITAGDSYAKQQMWEVHVTLPENMAEDAFLDLFTISTDDFDDDSGLQIKNGKVFYDQMGELVEMADITLTGGTYTFKREVDFRNAEGFLSSYYVYDGEGNLLAEVKNVPILTFSLPVTGIGIACKNINDDPILLDDYKLYPVGMTAQFEVYEAASGVLLADQNGTQSGDGAYRLSWLNSTGETQKANVVAAFYDAAGKLISEQVVKTVEMLPGADGVETGIVENRAEGQTLKLYMAPATEDAPGSSLGLILGITAAVLVGVAVTFLLLLKKRNIHNSKS